MQNRQIKLGALISYITIACNILIGLFYTPWMVNQIGQSDYGLFTLANSLISLFLVDFGLGSATSRYIAKYRVEGRTETANVFLGAVYRLYLLIDAVIFLLLIVVFFSLDKIYLTLSPEELARFQVVYIITGVYMLVSFPLSTLDGILHAYEKFIQQKTAVLLGRLLSIALTVAALVMGAGLYALVTIQAGAGLISILYKLIVVTRKTPILPVFSKAEKEVYREIFDFSIWVTITKLATRLVFTISPTILGIVSGSAAIAVFGIIATIEGYTFTFTTAINGMFLPRITRIYKGVDADQDIFPLMLKVGRFQFGLNCLIVLGFALVGQEFIALWMGPDYADAYWGILLVITPSIFYNSMQIANTALVVKKLVREQAQIALTYGLLNVVLSFPLSHWFGAVGAAGSICVAYTVKTLLYNNLYRKNIGVDIMLFAKKCYLPYVLPCILTIILGGLFNHIWGSFGWTTFFIKAGSITAAFLVSALIFVLTKDEKTTVFKAFYKR